MRAMGLSDLTSFTFPIFMGTQVKQKTPGRIFITWIIVSKNTVMFWKFVPDIFFVPFVVSKKQFFIALFL